MSSQTHSDGIDRITVIIPTRNEAKRIGGFLRSLPARTALIVVDASDDATPEVIARVRPENTRVIRSRAHIAAARQIGAEAAQTDWLLFSDADVAFAPGYFERVTHYLGCDAFYGPKYATSRHSAYSAIFNQGQRLCQSLGLPAASGSNMAVRRHAFAAVGGFRRDLPVNEDTELGFRLASAGYLVRYAPDLAVRSLDDRRLDLGATRKMLHSIARSALLLANLHVPMPRHWLSHDWGYWQRAQDR